MMGTFARATGMTVRRRLSCVALMIVTAALTTAAAAQQATRTSLSGAVVRSEFIGDRPPTASAHASTIVETPNGLVAAWFGGTREGARDVGIWMSRFVNDAWSDPNEVATGVSPDGTRVACYNPVLFYTLDGVLHLFYKAGTQPATWWGMHHVSHDDGRSWSSPERLPDGILGPIKNKPVVLADGTVISGSSTESVEATPLWRVHFEVSHDNARTWTKVFPAPSSGTGEVDAIQPSILTYANGQLQAIGRTRSQQLFESWSSDRGRSWSALALIALPNPNAGTDAVTLRDGRQLVVYNASTTARTPLSIATSRDGHVWTERLSLETGEGEYSYPAVIQSRDGLVHVTYTWRRQRIKHTVIDPTRLEH